MAPIRTTGSANERKGTGFQDRKRKNASVDSDALPGVQKLKSAVRQATRMLAREDLAADVRAATERRRAALESDLARAVESRTERKYATKYHMVKFFERQKVTRRIAKAKRANDDEGLRAARVDLNYILHFPKAEKYIALFAKSDAPAPETDARRANLRAHIERAMDAGELDAEPELRLAGDGEDEHPTGKRKAGPERGGVERTTKRQRNGPKRDAETLDAEQGAGDDTSISVSKLARTGKKTTASARRAQPAGNHEWGGAAAEDAVLEDMEDEPAPKPIRKSKLAHTTPSRAKPKPASGSQPAHDKHQERQLAVKDDDFFATDHSDG